jgi:two-component system, cell cycle response regulator
MLDNASRRRNPLAATIPIAIGSVLLAMIWAQALTGFGGEEMADVMTRWVYDGVFAAAAVACAALAVARPERRLVAALLAGGLACFLSGSIIYSLAPDVAEVPVPSISDPLWLAIYPVEYIALIALTRQQVGRTLWATRLDGLLGGLAVAAAVACFTVPVAIEATAGASLAERTTNLAYPIADLILLGAVVSALGLAGWRLSPTWATLATAILAWEVADHVYLFGLDHLGPMADALVATGGLGLAVAMSRRSGPPRRAVRADRGVFIPVGFGLLSLALLAIGMGGRLNGVALGLAGASLLVVLIRMAIALNENRALLGVSQVEATTDPLTGLANRRKLSLDLAEAFGPGSATASVRVLVLLDLNGFKLYNDNYGHQAGDALLVRLATALAGAVGQRGTAYRLGGDEFCVLGSVAVAEAGDFAATCAEGLASHGDGFSITAAYGVVLVPEEGDDPSSVLTLADQRMYRNKNNSRPAAARQSIDVLTVILQERSPDLADRMRAVSDLAGAIATDFGIGGGELEILRQAAAMHGIGKIAIPESVLGKPGELTPSDWELIRRHPVISERILAAAPALAPTARIVRWSNERVDGTGYPDRLSGEDIPLASRIIFVASAFCAMTTPRPHAPARTTAEALDELLRCAGTQYDPAVVAALAGRLAAVPAESGRAAALLGV